MANILKITFNGDCVDGDVLYYKRVVPGGLTQTMIYTFKDSPVAIRDVQIHDTGNAQALAFYNVFVSDPRNNGVYNVSIDDNVVSISILNGTNIFDVFENSDGITFTLIETPTTISGLDRDRYYINNPIIMTVGSEAPLTFYKVDITNLTNQKSIKPLEIYVSSLGYAEINLSPFLKTIFEHAGDVSTGSPVPTSNKFQIKVLNPVNDENIVSIEKTFIRGGVNQDGTNFNARVSAWLSPVNKVPVWGNYPTAIYAFDSEFKIIKKTIFDIPQTSIDRRRVKGCNEVYLKFLNQRGGYSNWLFESHETTESQTNLGGYLRNYEQEDLGNKIDNTLKLFTKLPTHYYPLILDLLASHDIYVYSGGRYDRVRLARNSVTYENESTGYYVTINLEVPTQFNPSPLWSN